MLGKVEFFTLLGGFACLALLRTTQSLPVTPGDIGPGVYHAAILGNYAGQLTGGQALNGLNTHAAASENNFESHDFSEGVAEDSPSLYESVGAMGDHLSEQHFPADYGAEEYKDTKDTHEYAEAESESAASEHHEDFEASAAAKLGEAHENEVDFGAQFSDHDEFYSKPVPGIDHGKGAYSYSTTYEFAKY